jgi:hypothetical protein
MRSAAQALAWEFWSANRRGWLLVIATIPACALLYRVLAEPIHNSDGLRSLSFLPMVISLILAAAFSNFTDRSRRNGVAGFPQHLFVRPVNTRFLVTGVMACAVASVIGIYLAWVKLVYEPVGIALLVRWPVTIIAVGMVFYQASVWCLSSFRLTRIAVLSIAVSALVGVGLLPSLLMDTGGQSIEGTLTAGLVGAATIAYLATVVTVGIQRRGGARGVEIADKLVDLLTSVIPDHRLVLSSANEALFWMEWRRSGLVLPAAVLLTLTLILGPILSITGRGPEETVLAAVWLAVLPLLLAFPVGKGMAKPDFWSLDLALSPFLTARPITSAQIVIAKLKAAAGSALLAWTVLLTIAPLWMVATCDLEILREAWGQFRLVYSPFAQSAIPVLLILAAMMFTWSLLVGDIWIGYAGRAGLFYSFFVVSAAGFLVLLIWATWWLDHPANRGELAVAWLPRIPWALAVCFTIKSWLAVGATWSARQRRLIPGQVVVAYLGIWLVATALLVFLMWLISPRVEWLRNALILTAVLMVPLARMAAAPLTIAWNRHR